MQKICLSYARNDILPESDCKGELWWLAENFSYCHSYVTSWQISESQRVLLQHSFLKSISPLYWQRPWTHTHKKSKKKKSTIIRWRLLTNRSIKSLFFLFFVFFFRQAAEAPHHATMNRRGSVLPHDTANTPPPSHNLAHTANQRSSLPTPLPGNKADREKEITPHEDVCDAVRGCWCSVGNIRLFCVD